jgi:hypothetical protein
MDMNENRANQRRRRKRAVKEVARFVDERLNPQRPYDDLTNDQVIDYCTTLPDFEAISIETHMPKESET